MNQPPRAWALATQWRAVDTLVERRPPFAARSSPGCCESPPPAGRCGSDEFLRTTARARGCPRGIKQNKGTPERSPAGVRCWRRSAAAISLSASLVIAAGGGRAFADTAAGEAPLTAAYLYNFTKFVRWPGAREGSADDPLVICLIGRLPIGPILREAVRGKMVRGHALRVRELSGAGEALGCHLVYIPKSEARRVEALLSTLPSSDALTVSNIGGFADVGGQIELTRVRERISFRINLLQTRERGLVVSSQMLVLAAEVIDRKTD